MKKEMAKKQIEILADFIMANVDGEPSQNEGAGDTAIRIIKHLQAENKKPRKELTSLQLVKSAAYKLTLCFLETIPEGQDEAEFYVPAYIVNDLRTAIADVGSMRDQSA